MDIPDDNSHVMLQGSNDNDTLFEPEVQRVQLVDDAHYDMRHERRGVAVIFSHKKFLHLPERKGTDEDCANLRRVLLELQFEVRVYKDLEKRQIKDVLDELSEEDHKNRDCLLVAIMTHGDDDMLHAKDASFHVDRLWENFVGNRCSSLLGKPKLFFIQACRGDGLDAGVQLHQPTRPSASATGATARELPQPAIVPGRAKSLQYAIPSMADLLVMYSTYKGHYSWRNPVKGSWFIESLCEELRANGNRMELLQLLTAVSRRVAFEFQSNNPAHTAQKQMPCIVSMLTKLVYFPKK
ncbi:caspase-like [Anopheles nili]|uniref:caspase-like n=1 Tax=Anopheles nili TaxID=185578 RepID=UPI00237C227B|nr:caspase-like [Anopheles nili]